MRALVLEEFHGPLVMKDVPVPAIGPHEALVRVRNVEVCGTDLKIRAGRLVFVGYVPELPMSVFPHQMVRDELEIMGSRATTKQELQETMNLVSQGRIRPVVDEVFSLEDVELAFDALRQGNSLGHNVVAM